MHGRTQISFASFYAGKFMLLGIQLPYFSGWLALRGFSAPDIGLITGAALVLRLALGPLVAYWADRQPDPLRALRLVSFVFAVSGAALLFPIGKIAIACAAITLIWSFGVLVPLTDSAATRADKKGLANFGQARATGSFAFLTTTLVGGELLTRLGLDAAAPLMALAAFATFVVGALMPAQPRTGETQTTSSIWSDARKLFSSRLFLIAVAASALIQGAHAVYYAFSILHWTSLGYSPRIIGALWATGVAAEILLLTRKRAATRLTGPATLLAIGAMGAVLRWSIIAFEPPLATLFLVQTLHALTFGATYIGSIEFLWRATPSRLINSAMAVTSTAGVGAATGIASMAAGFVFEAFGPREAYLMMAAMGAAALLLALWLRGAWRGEKLFD